MFVVFFFIELANLTNRTLAFLSQTRELAGTRFGPFDEFSVETTKLRWLCFPAAVILGSIVRQSPPASCKAGRQ